jgi:molecular chaperone GrpE
MGDTHNPPDTSTTEQQSPVSDATEPNDPLKVLLEAKEAAEKQALDFKDKLLRNAAEFENFKKRAKKEVEDAQHMGRERLLKELLGVVDNVTLALQHIPDDNAASKGVKLVEKQLMQTLEKFGLKRFSALGQPFDPNRHEAIQHVDTNDAAADTVVQEFACGYLYQDRLFRPAMVAVARTPGASA